MLLTYNIKLYFITYIWIEYIKSIKSNFIWWHDYHWFLFHFNPYCIFRFLYSKLIIYTSEKYFWGLQNRCRWWLKPWNYRMLATWKKSYDQPRQHIKMQRHYFDNKGSSSQSYDFSSSHVWMWELDYKESWVLKNRWVWTVVLEETLERPLDSQPTHPKGNQSSIFIRRPDVESETPVLWLPDAKSWLIGVDARKDWG